MGVFFQLFHHSIPRHFGPRRPVERCAGGEQNKGEIATSWMPGTGWNLSTRILLGKSIQSSAPYWYRAGHKSPTPCTRLDLKIAKTKRYKTDWLHPNADISSQITWAGTVVRVQHLPFPADAHSAIRRRTALVGATHAGTQSVSCAGRIWEETLIRLHSIFIFIETRIEPFFHFHFYVWRFTISIEKKENRPCKKKKEFWRRENSIVPTFNGYCETFYQHKYLL